MESIWSKTLREGDHGTGYFSDVREKLTSFRKEHPAIDLTLTVEPQNGLSEIFTVRFSLLSEKGEADLKVALNQIEIRRTALNDKDHKTRPTDEWEMAMQENALVFHISRASLFQHYHLYTEAAEEMDKAIAIPLGGTNIQFSAIWAHRRTGNTMREAAIIQRLPPGAKIPGDF